MRKVIFVLPKMKGGGAERVAAQLLNKFYALGYEAEFVLTHQLVKEAVSNDLNLNINITSIKPEKSNAFFVRIISALSSIICKPFELIGKEVPAIPACLSVIANNYSEYNNLRSYFKNNTGAVVIAFLQPSIPLSVLAAHNLDIRLIVSERGDANRLMRHRYGRKFIKRYYRRADICVFQTLDAMLAYPDPIARKGIVIPNPVKAGLPDAYHGQRNKAITTFCRVSAQKNLPLLIKAFSIVHERHPDYILRIIGDAYNDDDRKQYQIIKDMVNGENLESFVSFEPFMKDVHSSVIRDAMYINSSDYEGISNAMLEALSIGMPCICTDCPVGGAKQTITNGYNGLLVPCNDEKSLAEAIMQIIEDPVLSGTLSNNAAKIRDSYSLDDIANKWLNII